MARVPPFLLMFFVGAVFPIPIHGLEQSESPLPTLAGPSGYLSVPSTEVVQHQRIVVSSHVRPYKNSKKVDYIEWSMKATYGIRDLFEFGIENTVDNEQISDDPSPVLHCKLKLGRRFHRALDGFAMGLSLETDQENYSSAYLMYKNIGFNVNFGGTAKRGIARYGGYDHLTGVPRTFSVQLGLDTKKDLKEDLGIGRFVVDYNGDFFSSGWVYDFSDDFKGEIVWSSPSDYDSIRERSAYWGQLSRRF